MELHFFYLAKNAAGVLVEESFFVNRMNIFERKNNLFRIDKQQFPMDESIEKNFQSNANNVSVINFLLTSYPLNSEHYYICFKSNKFTDIKIPEPKHGVDKPVEFYQIMF